MDNRQIAEVLAEIASLLEIKGENTFKVRAYRSAADTLRQWPDPVARLAEPQLREIPGIGKDLAARIAELTHTGGCALHAELLAVYPQGLLDMLRLQGLGPKTVAALHGQLGIASIETLAEAARSGRLAGIKGMGPRKAAQILKAIDERASHADRHLLSETATVAEDILAHLRGAHAEVALLPVGSLRRGAETCGDLDILAVGADTALLDAVVTHPRVERVLGHGDTKVSVRLHGGYQVDVRLVADESRGAAVQYFTGSKAHNIALRDRASARGLRLNEYGLVDIQTGAVLGGATEESIYEALGLAWVPPELRENLGELEAAEAGRLPALIGPEDIQGDLHMHTTATDGRDTLEAMAEAAQRMGYRYVAITDHSHALAMANGLDERRALAHARAIRALNGRYDGLTLLAGIECDILADGRLDLADDCLAELDIVIASVHSHFQQEETEMTDRLLRAMACPWVDVVGHPTGRKLLKRLPIAIDLPLVAEEAARLGVALEINAQASRLDLNDAHARLARERGAPLVISSDAHAAAGLEQMRWGVQTARRGWVTADGVLNTLPVEVLRSRLRRARRTPGAHG